MARFILSAFADEIDPRFELQLASLNTLGIEYIELRGVDGRSFVTLSDRELDDIRRRMGIHGIKVWSLGSPLGKVRIDDAESQYALLDRLMEIGDKLGTRNIRMFSFYPVDGEPFEEYEKKVFFHINALTEKAVENGFVLCHENEKGIYGCSAERVKKLVDSTGGRLRVTLDNGNFIYCGLPAAGAFDLLKEHIQYYHIKDCLPGGVIVPPGKGDALIPELLAQINAYTPGDAVLTVEPHLTDFVGLSALSADKGVEHAYAFESPYAAFECAVNEIRRMLNAL
ncbi:MAG: sugar phosphate isomerase/epimerase [Clostridia bacterium]|nr:sugar phosphate isomerase/epimerase [Clostridia bacterium]